MGKKLTLLLVGAIIVIGGITVLVTHNSTSGMNSMPMASTSSSNQNAVASNSVTIQSYAFTSMAVKVKVGETVTWTNRDNLHHTVSVDSGTGPNSKPLNPGQTYSYTFKAAGTYNYHCDIHPEMHGTVIVTG